MPRLQPGGDSLATSGEAAFSDERLQRRGIDDELLDVIDVREIQGWILCSIILFDLFGKAAAGEFEFIAAGTAAGVAHVARKLHHPAALPSTRYQSPCTSRTTKWSPRETLPADWPMNFGVDISLADITRTVMASPILGPAIAAVAANNTAHNTPARNR